MNSIGSKSLPLKDRLCHCILTQACIETVISDSIALFEKMDFVTLISQPLNIKTLYLRLVIMYKASPTFAVIMCKR